MEPWDGPAAVAFTDGRQIGATLDRNGLRPARFRVTDDDLVVMASESGVLPIAEDDIVRKWRLQPGKMLLIDLEQGRIIEDEELKADLAGDKPYARWLDQRSPARGPRRGRARLSRRCRATSAARSPAGLRLHPGGHQVPRADGDGGRGSDRLDGHRHPDRGALGPAAAALRLFQAELRAGHQPADRSDPRGTGDEPAVDDRARAPTCSATTPARTSGSRSTSRS